jgi:hypothetical protein
MRARSERPKYLAVVALGAALPTMLSIASCAQLLDYDGLKARGTTDAASTDATSFDAQTTEVAVGDGASDVVDAPEVVEAGPTPLHPPTRPTGLPMTPSGKGKTLYLAVRQYRFGSLNVGGAPDPTAWQTIGWDIDGRCTDLAASKAQTNTCKRVPMASVDVLVDGQGCRDNNFGSQLIPALEPYEPNFESKANNALETGGYTIGLVIEDLDDGADDGYAPASIFLLDGMDPNMPKWDGTDIRIAAPEALDAGDITKPKITFPGGYVSGNVWVSGERADQSLYLVPSGTLLVLPIQQLVLTLPLDVAHTASGNTVTVSGGIPGSGIDGIIGPYAESVGVCPGTSIYNNIRSTFTQLADLVSGAPNLQDDTQQCNVVSAGIGFVMAPIAPITLVGSPLKPTTNKCADAGVDAATGG